MSDDPVAPSGDQTRDELERAALMYLHQRVKAIVAENIEQDDEDVSCRVCEQGFGLHSPECPILKLTEALGTYTPRSPEPAPSQDPWEEVKTWHDKLGWIVLLRDVNIALATERQQARAELERWKNAQGSDCRVNCGYANELQAFIDSLLADLKQARARLDAQDTDIREALIKVGIHEEHGSLQWLFNPGRQEVSATGGTFAHQLEGVLTETKYLIDDLVRRRESETVEAHTREAALQAEIDRLKLEHAERRRLNDLYFDNQVKAREAQDKAEADLAEARQQLADHVSGHVTRPQSDGQRWDFNALKRIAENGDGRVPLDAIALCWACESDTLHQQIAAAERARDAAQQQMQALRDALMALETYVNHKPWCDSAKGCDCGLKQTLSLTSELATPPACTGDQP